MSTSSASSYTDAFSLLSFNESDDRSRSSTQSFQTVGGNLSSVAFSDLGSSEFPGMVNTSQILSSDGGSSDGEEDLILVPHGSDVLRAGTRSRSVTHNSGVSNVSQGNNLRGSIRPGPVTNIDGSTFFAPRTQSENGSAAGEDDNSEDDSGTDYSDSADSDGKNEDDARARQRRWRDRDPEASVSDSSDEEDILFKGVGLSLATPVPALPGPTAQPLRVAPRAHMGIIRPPSNELTAMTTSVGDVFIITAPKPTSQSPITPMPPRPNTKPCSKPHAPVLKAAPPTATTKEAADSAAKTKARAERRKRARARKAAAKSSRSHSSDSSDSNAESLHGSNDAKFNRDVYQEAVAYVTKYLKDPPETSTAEDRLHFLQALIIELGLLSDGTVGLPTSCKAAKRLLKSQVHLNVKEYVAHRTHRATAAPPIVRSQTGLTKNQKKAAKKKAAAGATTEMEVGVGLVEIQKLLYPSRSALIKSLRAGESKATRKIAPLSWVKKTGLDIFLVTVFR